MKNIRLKLYRVSASLNPTRQTNAKRIWVSSGRVPLYDDYNNAGVINFSIRWG